MAGAELLLTACAQLDRNAHADALAATAGLKREQIVTASFVITAWSRIGRPDQPIDLYIEGDGLAWLSRSEPSLDPTPREAMGLALAVADPALNVAYVARPCQFTPIALNPRCNIPYWTGRRFAPDVVASTNEAVDQIAARAPGQRINLIGYSGGAAIAVLVAARRRDIASIRTVAGNLDDEYINRIHHVSAMPESLNPIDFAPRVSAIPQIHFDSDADIVVTPEVARRFISAAGGRCAAMRTVHAVTHDGDWSRLWPGLLGMEPKCRGEP
ncbi:alpha/beta hydrolase [Trinickia symbiotica]|uniref:Alpha/beta hydrolase n=1 Tax=Trinickia symbiotica TaxID=863227 RepID=A0A2T3XK18_9BURK|nr:alpha/beta hydrolase [Trinickia symbiotica]PTB16875.1 alpha/beta hydrolase [Trinickia symbiotica]